MRRWNTTKCPMDGEPLHWEQHFGMRIIHTNKDGIVYYNTRCPKCGKEWRVKKAKQK